MIRIYRLPACRPCHSRKLQGICQMQLILVFLRFAVIAHHHKIIQPESAAAVFSIRVKLKVINFHTIRAVSSALFVK